jgi:hypothetical protein
MLGFMKKRAAKPQKATKTEEMTNLKQEERLASAQGPDEKPKYSYHDSFKLPRPGICAQCTPVTKDDRHPT